MEALTEATTDITRQDFRLFLKTELLRRVSKNPSYSLRAFAGFLDIDHSTLSQIMRGKRKVSKQTCQKMSRTLGLDLETEQGFLDFLESENSSADMMKFHQMKVDLFVTISDWTHDAILELIKLKNFKADVVFVAQNLGLETEQVQQAVDRLVRVGLLKIENDQWLDISGNNSVLFDGAFTNPVMQAYQQRLLSQSILTVENVEKTLRDHTSVVMAVDASLIPEIRDQIKVFRRSLASFIEKRSEHSADQVYAFQISLFPLTGVPHEKP